MADTPQHVAIIMDGNGRWARSRGMPRPAGHRASLKVVRRVVEECSRRKIPYLTLFAFSSENWRRPPDEVGLLMKLFLESMAREVSDLHKNGVRLRFIGDRGVLGTEITRTMQEAEALTARNLGLGLCVAFAYGGRWDIAQACRSLAARRRRGHLAAGRDRRGAYRRALGARRHTGPGSAHPHRRGIAHQQFPAVEFRLRRAVFHRGAVSRLRCGGVGRGAAFLRAA